MKIYAPVKDFNGLRNNVRFVNGVGETSDPKIADWFKSHGYKVALEESNLVIPTINDKIGVENDDSEFVEINNLAEDKPDFESMTPNDIRDWAKANGYGGVIKNTRSKEKLIEILRG